MYSIFQAKNISVVFVSLYDIFLFLVTVRKNQKQVRLYVVVVVPKNKTLSLSESALFHWELLKIDKGFHCYNLGKKISKTLSFYI